MATRTRDPNKCRRCSGVGISWWDALIDGMASIVGGWVGTLPPPTLCNRCGGTGSTEAR